MRAPAPTGILLLGAKPLSALARRANDKTQSPPRQRVLHSQPLATATTTLRLSGAATSPACGVNLLADDRDFRNDGHLALNVKD
jgi:hypothetical protein